VRRDAVFDLDGTLVDSVVICTELLNEMLAERGSARRLGLLDVQDHISVGGARMIAALFGDECGDPDREIAEFRARYAARPTPPESLFPGVLDALDRLRCRDIRLSICSNKPQHLCEKVLRELGLAPLFVDVCGARAGSAAKPDPSRFLKLLERLGGDRDRCCYIGDAAIDQEMASRAGVPFIWVSHGYGQVTGGGDLRCEGFALLPDLIDLAVPALASSLSMAAS
jgi:phosphoglycolate phosphatase